MITLPPGVETLPIEALTPYARNARTHSPEQVDKIAASMIEFGWTQPVLIDAKGEIIAGHGRVLAAQALGQIDIPVIRLKHLTPEQKRAYVLADNQLATLGGWDNTLLAEELASLAMVDYDLGVIGFPAAQVEALMAGVAAELERTGSTLEGLFGRQRDPGAATANPADEPTAQAAEIQPVPGSLAARFGVPPFTVLNAREGWWQDRKRAWLALGIKSELGRGAAPGGSPAPLDRPGNFFSGKGSPDGS